MIKEQDLDVAQSGYVLDEAIGFILRQATQRHTAIFAAHMGDVTATQWAALSKLAELGTSSQNLLGRLTAMDAPTVKGVIDRLMRRGLVEAIPDPDHKRRFQLTLTKEGVDLVNEKIPAAAAVSEETLRPLSAREAERLTELLSRLR